LSGEQVKFAGFLEAFLRVESKNYPLMRETLRQVVHLIFGLVIAALIPLLDSGVLLRLLALSILIGLAICDALIRGYWIPVFSPVINFLERREALPGNGALLFAMSVLFCLILFEPQVVVAAVVVLALLDSIATVVGRRAGKIRIYNGKSLEGSVAGTAAAFVALLALLPVGQAAAAAVAAGIVELLSPIDDNLVIPVTVCIVLGLMG
jgi:phytol kinase